MKAPKIKRYVNGGNVQNKDNPKKTVKQWEEENVKAGLQPIPYNVSGAAPSVYKQFYNPVNYPDPSKLTGVGEGSINVNDIYTYKSPVNFDPQTNVIPTSNRQFLANDANGNTTYKDNATGQTYTLDKTGNNVGIVQQYNKGGKVMKAPSVKGKGYAGGGTVQLDADGNPILSNNTLPLTSGTQFQTQGDYPINQSGTSELVKQPSEDEMKARQGANIAGKALGAYGTGYFATKQGTSEGDNARSAGLSIIGQSGAIGGAISGLAAIGDKIGAPIKSKSEQVDMNGNLKNSALAKRNGIIGVTLSPSERLTYKGGLTDVSGQGYLNSIQDKYKKQIQDEKNTANQNQISEALTARNAGDTNYKSVSTYRPHAFAEGGKIVGKGTAKSDSIDAKVEGGSHIIPKENAPIAEEIRKVFLKKAPKMKPDLKQNGGEEIRVSNGEHIFSADEVAKLESLGIDLDDLSPNAKSDNDAMKEGGLTPNKALQILKDGTIRGKKITEQQRKFFGYMSNKAEGGIVGYAEGGTVPEGTKLGQYYYKNGKWSDGKGNILTKEFGQKYTDAYNKQVNPSTTKTGAQLENIGKKYPSAPSVKKVVPKTNNSGITNENYLPPQDNALLDLIKNGGGSTISPAQNTTNTPQSVNKTTETPAQTNTDNGKSWKAWSSTFGNALGNAVETGASLAQIKLGHDALTKAGARPIGQIDPSFQANVDRAHAQSKYGFSAEQNFLLNQENQNATNAARFAARNYSGGSGGNAFNMERSAINEGWGRGLQAKIANQNFMLDKQQVDNQLSLQKAQMSRQLFDDKLNAWMQNQQAGGALKNQGFKNLVGAGRYASALSSINAQNELAGQ